MDSKADNASSTFWSPSSKFNETVDQTYGFICCLCFLIGTIGNIVSFIYFKSRKRDISSFIYMMITANDVLVSIAILPLGTSLLSNRQPGLLFGNRYGCVASVYYWEIAVAFSIFLVMCISISRTISLLRPFKHLKLKYLIISVMMFLATYLASLLSIHFTQDVDIHFYPSLARCKWNDTMTFDKAETITHFLFYNTVFTAPALIVATSCVISSVLLTRRNKDAQIRELQQSRNRATVTILLFTLLYGVCNIPIVVDMILLTHGMNSNDWYLNMFKFDTQGFYDNTVWLLLPAVNSTANPILYCWRMPRFRESTLNEIRKMFGLNREISGPPKSKQLRQPTDATALWRSGTL